MQIRNTVTLIGHVGQEPQTRKTSNGRPMLSFSFATNDTWRDKEGELQTRTDWHDIVVFGAQAERMQKLVKKGTKLLLSGSLRYNKWVDKNEQKRVNAQVQLNGFELLTPKKVEADAQPFG